MKREPQGFSCRSVVFAASALGTVDLLFRLKQKGSLPAISVAIASVPTPNRLGLFYRRPHAH